MKGKQGFQKGHKFFKGSEKYWFKKGATPQNKGIPQSKETKEKQIKSWTIEKKLKARKQKLGKNNTSWSGDDVGYGGVHLWICNKLGKPNYCEICKKTRKKMYHWANKKHTYKRIIKDYMRLCASCQIGR